MKKKHLDLVAQIVKCLSAMQDAQVRPLCWEDPLEKEMATYSSILAWEIPWTQKPARNRTWGCKKLDMIE